MKSGIGSEVECSWCGDIARKRGTKAGVFCDNRKCKGDHHAAKKGVVPTIVWMWLLIEQDLSCAYCERMLPPDLMEVDHVLPRSAGGGDGLDNLRVSCPSCNKSKGSNGLGDFLERGLRWDYAPALEPWQAEAAFLYYARHKRLVRRCRGILDGRIEPLTEDERDLSGRLLGWLEGHRRNDRG